MKKIFAIALALVMVLSMASAFAANCVVPDWACAEDVCALGKGKVEVVPFVMGNACADDNTFTASTCAAALNNDWVFAAIKVTVEENPNEAWWAAADLVLDAKGMKTSSFSVGSYTNYTLAQINAAIVEGAVKTMVEEVPANKGKLKAGEYYIVPVDGTENPARTGFLKAVPAADFEASWATLFNALVSDYSKAKFCASLVSAEAADMTTAVDFNGYKVKYNANYDATHTMLEISNKAGDKVVNVFVDSDNKISAFQVQALTEAADLVKNYNVDKTAFFSSTDDADLSWSCTENGKFLKAVMEAFKFDFKTCITEKAVETYFAWDDKIDGCFTWNKNAQLAVDAECVVAIPKTGDASVLAWLF